MTFIDDWRSAIPGSLAEFAALIEVPADVTPVLAAAMLWPLRAALCTSQPEAVAALQALAGEHAEMLRAAAASWSDDRRAAVDELTAHTAATPPLSATLLRLVTTLLATPEIAGANRAQLVNLIVRIGDTVSISDVRDSAIAVKSTLTDVEQRIGAATALEPALRDILRQLIAQIGARPAAINLDAAQALLATLPTDAIPAPAALPPGSRLHLSCNPLFVGRAADFTAIAAVLRAGETTAVITGIGGVGKTQLAVEVAQRYGQFFAGGVFWLSFTDPRGVAGEIVACGGIDGMNLPGFSALDFADQVSRVLDEWRQPIPRLLIFDNCEDDALLRQWRPTSGGSRVLVTSRRGVWSRALGVTAHPLGVLSRAESVTLLQRYRPDIPETAATLIATALGDLPLALHVAGSYLETYQDDLALGDPAAFLAELNDVRLLAHPALQGIDVTPSATNHQLHVAKTFALSFDQLKPGDPTDAEALRLLARAACFAAGERIPREPLLATLALPQGDREAERQASRAVNRLIALGLLEREAHGALRIHRLLAAFAQQTAPDAGAQAAVEDALTNEANRLDDAGFPAQLLPVIAHLHHALTSALLRGDAPAAALANAAARAEAALTNYAAARPLYERALAIHEQTLGPQHPATATSLNNLALLLQHQGDYAAARPLYERALAICEQALGPQHPTTATSLNNLAVLYADQGDFGQAIPLLERALAIYEQALGPQHPDTTSSRQSLEHMRAAAERQQSGAAMAALLAALPPAVSAAITAQDPAALNAALAALPPEQAAAVIERLQAAGMRRDA
jgi:tetratricopeptide (TPR) repeat protein